MKDHTIKSARQFIRRELSPVYPGEEVLSLAKLILLEASQLTQTEILADPHRLISDAAWDKINKICSQLKENKPIQYILGKAWFYGLELEVNEHVLIPRQETEELVDLVIKENKQSGLKIIDLGTGSGAIAIALCKNMKHPEMTATDISGKALETAFLNSRLNKCNITFLKDDILNSSVEENNSYDLLVSNPPYIRESEKSAMHRNVLDYEPGSALFVSDSDPLVYYRAIGRLAKKLLKHGGTLYLEINEALGKESSDILEELGMSAITIIKDINNKDRIIKAIRL